MIRQRDQATSVQIVPVICKKWLQPLCSFSNILRTGAPPNPSPSPGLPSHFLQCLKYLMSERGITSPMYRKKGHLSLVWVQRETIQRINTKNKYNQPGALIHDQAWITQICLNFSFSNNSSDWLSWIGLFLMERWSLDLTWRAITILWFFLMYAKDNQMLKLLHRTTVDFTTRSDFHFPSFPFLSFFYWANLFSKF